jgi:transcriptional regulator with XRE-family HTH domain
MTEQEWREEFSDRLRALKWRRRQWNQKELAEASNLSEMTISNYMNASRTPDILAIINIAIALDCRIDELIPAYEMIER